MSNMKLVVNVKAHITWADPARSPMDDALRKDVNIQVQKLADDLNEAIRVIIAVSLGRSLK